MHNSGGLTTTTSSNNVNNTVTKQIQIQAQPSTQTITNAQVCLDSMQISDVDVRISLSGVQLQNFLVYNFCFDLEFLCTAFFACS